MNDFSTPAAAWLICMAASAFLPGDQPCYFMVLTPALVLSSLVQLHKVSSLKGQTKVMRVSQTLQIFAEV